MGKKKIKTKYELKKGITTSIPTDIDSSKIVWSFDKVDRSGAFAFDTKIIEKDNNLKEITDKIISISSMTWNEICRQTHDNGKTKHHYLNYDSLSKEAKNRIEFMNLYEDAEDIFSFALQNKLRIIGTRHGTIFYVKWYDPEHKFCPSTKKHT